MKDYPYPMQARNEALCPFTRDTQLSGFLTLPKSLLCWGLSPGALLVYGLLLDRGKLSQRSGWTDKQGWVYVIFPVRELALALGKGVTTIKRWLRELEERELIFRTVPFQGEAGWIFLRVPRCGVEGEREKALQTAERLATSRLWAVAGPTQVRPMSFFGDPNLREFLLEPESLRRIRGAAFIDDGSLIRK